MEKGTLSFALNGNSMGIAFTSDELKKEKDNKKIIYPAISLIYNSESTLKFRDKIPGYLI